MQLSQAHQSISKALIPIYGNTEAYAMAFMVLEHVTSISKQAFIAKQQSILTIAQQQQIELLLQRLIKHEPIQYVLGEAWFYLYKFYVNNSVLIPRPETEELVEKAIQFIHSSGAKKVIDIGTGSGCIAISIAKQCPHVQIVALDVSAEALKVARHNAQALNADVQFIQSNFLEEETWRNLGSFDLIISNPPYIAQHEENTMMPHVVAHEPHLALFVPDHDPLIFYKKIAQFAMHTLLPGGKIFCEINERLGQQTLEIFESFNPFSATILLDAQGKERIIKVSKDD